MAHIFLTVGNDDSNSERLEDDFKTQFDTTYAERIWKPFIEFLTSIKIEMIA